MNSLVSQGAPLALFGTGVVFVFLCLLVLATRAMSVLIERFGPVTDAMPARQAELPVSPPRMAAAVAAIGMHRARQAEAPPRQTAP